MPRIGPGNLHRAYRQLDPTKAPAKFSSWLYRNCGQHLPELAAAGRRRDQSTPSGPNQPPFLIEPASASPTGKSNRLDEAAGQTAGRHRADRFTTAQPRQSAKILAAPKPRFPARICRAPEIETAVERPKEDSMNDSDWTNN